MFTQLGLDGKCVLSTIKMANVGSAKRMTRLKLGHLFVMEGSPS